MSHRRLQIWSNNPFSSSQEAEREMLTAALGDHNYRLFEVSENGLEGASAEFLAEADVAFGSPAASAIRSGKNLAWVHVNSAGYAAYDDENFKREMKKRAIVFTNSSAVFDEPCAQHLLAMILSLARKLPAALNNQRGEKAWNYAEIRSKITLLNQQIVIIYGFGAIAQRLVELLAPLKMKVIGVRRHIKGNETIQIITENKANDYLSLADHIVNILPENVATENYFDHARFSKVKPGSFFYNIGRGRTINQEALINTLQQAKIAAAYLDVTDPEPLPFDHALWTAPNCYITPHIAGGSADEKSRQIAHFLANLKRFQNEQELADRII